MDYEKLIQYFQQCPAIQEAERFVKLDELEAGPDAVSLMIRSLTPEFEEDVTGEKRVSEWTLDFNLYIRAGAGQQASLKKANQLMITLVEWLAEQHIAGNYPDVGSEVTSFSSSSLGLIGRDDGGTTLYQIRCQMQYIPTLS